MDKMIYKKLGNTDIDVSAICLGTMTWGEQNDEKEGHQQMDYAIEKGINFWDTAELYAVPARAETYGATEKIIGTWFKKTGKREDVVLATKIAGPGDYTKHIRVENDYTAESLTNAVNESLKRLQTDYIDVYQLHWPARKTNYFGQRGYSHDNQWHDNMESVLRALGVLITQGKIRHIGVSNETPWGFTNYLKLAEVHNLPKIVSVQNPYGLLNRTYEYGMSEISIREQAGLLAYSPMAYGLLSGKYHKKQDTAESRINKFKALSRYNSTNSWVATEKYQEIADKYGISLAQMSLAWVVHQTFVTSAIIGATNMEQLIENIDCVQISMTDDMVRDINEIQENHPNPAP